MPSCAVFLNNHSLTIVSKHVEMSYCFKEGRGERESERASACHERAVTNFHLENSLKVSLMKCCTKFNTKST